MWPFSFKPANPPTATVVRRRPSLDFSITGLVYCSMMMFMGLAAINSQANLLFGVFGLMIGILIISGVISRLVLRKLRVTRELPKHGVVGEPIPAYYHIHNGKRFWPSLSVGVAELDGVEAFSKQPQCYMLHAAPRMTAAVPAELLPKRRGLHHFNQFQLCTSFPFGFIKRAVMDRHKDVVSIFPPLAEVDARVIAMCRSADNSGESVRPRPGGMDEFYGLKEYRAGDSPRHIYWRRSARTGVLVSKEMTRVAPPRLLLLVDTFLADRSLEQHARVERAIAMAASLASAALAQELSVGLCTWSARPVLVPPTRGKQQRDDLLTILARLPLNTTFRGSMLLEQSQRMLRPGTTAVLLTAGEFSAEFPDRRRGDLVVISAASEQAKSWFRFRAEVAFESCMPLDQDPTKTKRQKKKPAGPAPTTGAAAPSS